MGVEIVGFLYQNVLNEGSCFGGDGVLADDVSKLVRSWLWAIIVQFSQTPSDRRLRAGTVCRAFARNAGE